MARKGAVTTIDLSGPFFEKDPRKTFRQNVRTMLDAMAAEGEADVRAQLGVIGSATLPGLVRGYTTSIRTGRHWVLSGAVGHVTSRLDKTAATRANAILYGRRKGNHGVTVGVEGRAHPYRKTKNRLNRSRAVNVAELTKGMT